jgi:pimeloyl-ACP methyl ester carboxylesterase
MLPRFPRIARFSRIARLAACLLCVAALGAQAGESWQTLPPTPSLPGGTVGRHLDVGGARLWYALWGPRSPSPPVLLLHGGFANSNYFGNLIPALVSRGHRVIAMDSPGHGRSTLPEGPLTYHGMAEDVIGLLDQLKVSKVFLVGWSDGGIIGLDIALNHPDRLAGVFAFGANADVSGVNEGAEKTSVFGAYLRRAPQEYRTLSPTPERWEAFSAAVNKMWETLPAYTAEQLRSIRVPVTIADGEHDEAIKQSHDRYMASTIPGARLDILPGVSHFAMLQNPSEFNAAVFEFLKAR